MSERNLKGAAVVVTGAGSGVGAALCALLDARGANIAMTGRRAEKLEETKNALTGGGDHLIIAGDVGDSAFCSGAAAQAAKHYGRLDVLVNNAGVMRRGAAADTTDEDWAAVMRANVDGVFYMSRAALPRMQDGGAIVNTASTCGLVGAAGLAAYCASKGAVVQLTRAMALECAARQITVNAVCPGAIEAPMLFSAHADGASDDSVRERSIKAIPLGRIATADEVARAIIHLAVSPHTTGAMLSIDGGYTAG